MQGKNNTKVITLSDMKIGIMQPYLFPYIGYFQLINAVDRFVIYDDVQYIKGGWINRNRIQINNKDYLFTFNVKRDSLSLPINQRVFTPNFSEVKEKFLSLLFQAYHNAPHFSPVQSLVKDILSFPEHNVSSFITNSLQMVCSYMNITTPFIFSSQIKKNNLLKGQERVIDINLVLRSTDYINLMGGINLYTREKFDVNKIKLNFIKMKKVEYHQLSKKFMSNLSILDVLMFNDLKSIKAMLLAYDLV